MSTDALVVDGVGVRRARRRVLDGVSVRARGGDVIGVVGANGAGKSTLLAAVAGVLAPDRGAILVGGASVWGTGASRVRARGQLGYVPEGADPPGHLSGDEVLALVAAVKRAPPLAVELRERLGIIAIGAQRIDRMSLGQRRRTCLGAALIGDPALIVLDEPTNGLDAAGVEMLIDVLAARRSAGAALLISSHDAEFLDRMGASRLVLEAGRALPPPRANDQVSEQEHDLMPDQTDHRDPS